MHFQQISPEDFQDSGFSADPIRNDIDKKITYRNLYIFPVDDGVIPFDDGVITQQVKSYKG